MRARVEELGGTIAFETPEEGGTRLVVNVPLSLA
jgi:signal transduction histidine kinase